MEKFYRLAAGQPEKLPWNRDAPDVLLRRAVEARAARGRARDVGCGAGVFTIWLAQSGMEAVGIDPGPVVRGAGYWLTPRRTTAR